MSRVMTANDKPVYLVIMAGGSGTRFWPMSRAAYPKQFLKIIGEHPMVRATYERVKMLTTDERIILVVGGQHRQETQRLFADTNVHILVEPFGRNTAPCIGLAVQYIARLSADAVVVILPADHYVAEPEALRNSLQKAMEISSKNVIVTLGIIPTRPETGYGYIERKNKEEISDGAYQVARFVEKPDLNKARQFLESGRFYWNAGIFVATAQTLLDEFESHMPDFYKGLNELPSEIESQDFARELEALYSKTESISFDYAIMENPDHPVYVIPSDCGWSDVGSWYSLYELRQKAEQDSSGNVFTGDVIGHDNHGCFVLSEGGRLVATLGLKNVLVVDTSDALLIADLERSQDVKKITSLLAKKGRKDLL